MHPSCTSTGGSRAPARASSPVAMSPDASPPALPSLLLILALAACGGDEPTQSGGAPGAQPPPPRAAVAGSSHPGKWEGPYAWPLIPIHLHLLPNARVLAWSGEANMDGSNHSQRAVYWDPAPWPVPGGAGTFTSAPAPGVDIFCSGHAYYEDGRLLVAGGHDGSGIGLPNVNVFNFAGGGTWTRTPRMAKGRWYPTVTALPNGEMLVTAGTDSVEANVTIPEVVRRDGTLRRLTSAPRPLPYYPWMFVASNGRVFYAGAGRDSRYLNTSSTGSWSSLISTIKHPASRTYGSAVMYDAGKVLIIGGGDPPTATAEVINLSASSPQWSYTGTMAFARRQQNATILPDGKVLVTGGTSGPGFNNKSTPVYAAEMWDPATGVWTRLASMSVYRLYHSTALLLPDGRVLVAGGGRQKGIGTQWDRLDAEIYSPPYLFNDDGTLATRPTITAAPASVGYATTFDVETPDAASIAKVTWLRLGSVTHAFDENQRFGFTRFTLPPADTTIVVDPVTGVPDTVVTPPQRLRVNTPMNPNNAPPGHYMLFILNARGVPSVAKIVRLVR